MEIKKDNKNELMQRREVIVQVEMEKTPSNAESAKLVVDEFKSSEDKVMIEQVKGTFGKKTFLIKASIYNTKELKDEAIKRSIKTKKAPAPAAA